MAIFKPGKCHHRNAEGQPDCNRAKVKPWANLCKEHEAEYRAGKYRARATAFGRKASTALSRAPRSRAAQADGAPRKRRADRAKSGGTSSSRSSPQRRRRTAASPA